MERGHTNSHAMNKYNIFFYSLLILFAKFVDSIIWLLKYINII